MPKAKQQVKQDSPEIAILRQGMTGQFWQTLKKLLQQDIDAITQKILEDDSLSNVPTPMTLRDLARIERSKMLWLFNYPLNKINIENITSIENDPDDE